MTRSTPPQAETFTEAARRAQILQAAIDTVNDVGYPRASLAEIARHAGVAKSATVYYFATKDALLLHVVEHVFTALDQQLAASVHSDVEPARRLRDYAEAHLDYVDAHRAEFAAAIEIALSHRVSDGTPLYLTFTEQDSVLLRGILGDGIAQGAFRSMPLGAAVRIVEALLDVPTSELQRDLTADLTDLLPEVVTSIFGVLAVQDTTD